MAESGDFVLANQAGELLVGDPSGTNFSARKASQPWRYTSTIQAYNGKLLFSALEGIHIERVK